MKQIEDIAFVVQARLKSERVPNKMIRPFADSNLFGIILDKLLSSNLIPSENIIASVYEEELLHEANIKRNIRTFNRSKESANSENDIKKIYEWHDKIPHPYVILISGCNPLLSVESIDGFTKKFINQEEENLFAVIEKKNYFWNSEKSLITSWPDDLDIMNTKFVDSTYEAAHCLYASKIDLIKDNKFMVDLPKENLILYTIPEVEAFDIDYEWQFKIGEKLYEQTQSRSNR